MISLAVLRAPKGYAGDDIEEHYTGALRRVSRSLNARDQAVCSNGGL